MVKILLFCEQAWTEAAPSPATRYAYEVFSRIAAQGHAVTWFARRGTLLPPKTYPNKLEIVDNIQLVRFGYAPFYQRGVSLFLSRLVASGTLAAQFDVLVDCVTKRPNDLGMASPTPVLPVIFSLHKRIQGLEDPPGPMIATSDTAHATLMAAGTPEAAILKAPFAEHDDWEDSARVVLDALHSLVASPDNQ